MEKRQIAIANTKTQKRYIIETSATTLGELQDQLSAQGIDYSGMTFTEGISKTQLLTRDTQLPTNVMYKGQPTNNLVMLLTNPTKQIASGAYPTNRKEFGEYIKKNNLGDKIKAQFGDNWTHISTTPLMHFFAAQDKKAAAKTEEDKHKLEEVHKELVTTLPDIKGAPHAQTVEWFYDGIKHMAADNLLYAEDVAVIANLTTELATRLMQEKPRIDDMLEDVAGFGH